VERSVGCVAFILALQRGKFLGTSASVPSADRNHPGLLVEAGGHRIMIDCGEGTQRQLLRRRWLQKARPALADARHFDNHDWIAEIRPNVRFTFLMQRYQVCEIRIESKKIRQHSHADGIFNGTWFVSALSHVIRPNVNHFRSTCRNPAKHPALI
jgi:hypothetical protein